MSYLFTTNLGLVAVREEVPSAQDWAATYWNWINIDKLVYNMTQHHHTGASALANPDAAPTLTTDVVGGTLPGGKTYFGVVSYYDAFGRETGKSAAGTVTTAAALAAPATPTHNFQATPIDLVADNSATPIGLLGGDYWYKLTYIKGGGETTASDPVYVSIPTDTLYAATIHFTSLTDIANGADKIFIYRKSGTGNYVKLIEISAVGVSSYTDNNTAVVNCDKQPPAVNSTNSFNTVIFDWSGLSLGDAAYVNLYITTTGTVGTPTFLTSHRITSVATGGADSYEWTGTALTTGKPLVTSQSLTNPSKVNFETEVTGATWLATVSTFSALPSAIGGDARIVEDEGIAYWYDDALATPAWTALSSVGSGGGITRVVMPLDDVEGLFEDYLPYTDLQDGDICFISTEATESADKGYRTGLYQYHENWATPGWAKLNTVPYFPYDIYNNYYPFAASDVGDLAVVGTSWGSFNLVVKEDNGYTFTNIELPLGGEDLGLYLGYGGNFKTLGSVSGYFDYTSESFAWWGSNGISVNTWLDKSLVYWSDDDESWYKNPTFTFRGTGSTPPTFLTIDDIFLQDDKLKQTITGTSKNLIPSIDQAGQFQETFVYNDPPLGWEVIAAGTATVYKMYYGGDSYGGIVCAGVIQINPGNTAGDGIKMEKNNYPIPVTVGNTYTFSFYHRGAAANKWKVRLEWLDSGKNSLSFDDSTVAETSGTRTEKTITATAPASSVYCIVHIVTATTNVASTCYFSEFQFEEGSVATDWVSPARVWESVGFSKYRGYFDTPTNLPVTAEDGDTALVETDGAATPVEINSFYTYDADLATPAWIQIGVQKTSAVADVSLSATPTDVELKLNELLAALRTSGVIST